MGRLRVAMLTLCLAWLAGLARFSFAEDSLAVVVGRTSPLQSLSLENLKSVYLRKSLLDEKGLRWIPLNLPPEHALRQAFSLAIFKELPEDQEEYWNTQYFHGINPPQVLASEEAVIRFLFITPGSIGYVRKQSVDERVKVLKIIPIPTQ